MKKAVVSFLFFLFIVSLQAQNKNRQGGSISGRIIDSLSGQPVDYATIGLLTQSDNKVVNGITSDAKGEFRLTNVAEGTYKMLIDFIGYKRIEKNNVVVSKDNQDIFLGDIKIASKQTILKEASVTSEKSLIENKIDKMVFNADKDVTSQGGVAADVLKKVPQVSVDVDGNVELQGNSNIRFLINGKPSVLFGSNIADVLQSIPASQIQSIEVITSPGAKYDAEGTGGIINIILKKSTAQGMNGNISLAAGTRMQNASINLSARKGKLGVNTFFSGNALIKSKSINNSNRLSQDSATSSQLLQNGTGEFIRNGFQSGIGFDFDINSKNNMTANFSYNYFGFNNTGSANRRSLLFDNSGSQVSDVNDVISTSNKFHDHSFDFGVGYKKKFEKEDQELEFLINNSLGNKYSHYEQAQKQLTTGIIDNSSSGNNPGTERETNIMINYTHPVSKEFIVETGAKTELDLLTSNSDVYLLNKTTGNYDFNPAQSSSVNYKRNVYAAYLSATFKVFKILDLKPGIRNEYTEAKADFSNSGNVAIKPYNTLVPSIVISHTFKNRQLLKITYSHRIERPHYRDLNPFLNASDPKNINTGNPNLQPEIGDKIELGYSQTFKKGTTINTTLFYQGNMDDIQSYTRYYSTYKIGDSTYNNVAVSTRENIGREDNFGLNLFGSFPITGKLNIRSNISAFQRYIKTGISSIGDINGFNYRINVNASYQVGSTLIIEAFGNFNSPRTNAQGTMPSFSTYNFALRKQLFNKKASIALTANNPFSEYLNQKTSLTGDNFTIENNRQLPFRSFGVNFTYKFGKMEFKRNRNKESDDINLSNPPGE